MRETEGERERMRETEGERERMTLNVRWCNVVLLKVRIIVPAIDVATILL